jgi:hypothetical protein
MSRIRTSKTWVKKVARKNKCAGYFPAATIAFYGPDADRASKVAVGIFLQKSDDPDFLERWYSDETDVRTDEDIGRDILELLKSHAVTSCVVVDGIIGCPHEEGIDYPEGKSCPQCPFWAGRDRFLHERIH